MNTELLSIGIATLTGWDIMLIVVVSTQATVLAYLRRPQLKAFLLCLPIPFTLATLSLGRPIDSTNVLGLILLMGYHAGVYLLHARLRVPIVPTIGFCAAAYCGLATTIVPHLPRSPLAFWLSTVFVFGTGVALYRLMPSRDEPTHRTALPPYIKTPLVAVVILFIVIIKQQLQGFMTVFPMVSTVASYEGRHCLWTIMRQIPVLMITITPMMVTIHLLEPNIGMGWALAGGWVVFLAVLLPFTRYQWATDAVAREAEA